MADAVFGEPRRWHPLVGFGFCAQFIERHANRTSRPFLARVLGVLAWLSLMLPVAILFYFWPRFSALWHSFFTLIAVYFAVAYKSLEQHVMAIYWPLRAGNLNAARSAVAMIVSRDTQHLDEQSVRKAAIESCLENGSDGVLAPLFWLVIGGAPAVIAYRLMNTLDAMWGYKTTRMRYFGWFAARMDDAANWLPARLVALSYSVLGHTSQAWSAWRLQAPLCASPNAGPVMAAGAGALDIQLGGPTQYQQQLMLKPYLGTQRPATDRDLLRALRLVRNCLWLWGGMTVLILCAIEFYAVFQL